MNTQPAESSVPQYTKESIFKATEPNQSLETEIKQPSLATDHKETSTDYVQSYVIVNDIDVEEELSKAQKDNNNFFKALSMSFYGKVKSHSLDHQESRNQQKLPNTPQGGFKSIAARKASANTPQESKTNTSKLGSTKQKTQETLKKDTPVIKGLQLIPEQFRKRLLSPNDESIKIYSPVVAGKKIQMGNFVSRALPKKETASFFDTQQRPQTSIKGYTGQRAEESHISVTPDLYSITGRSRSPKYDPKKASPLKNTKTTQKMFDNFEDKVHTLYIEPGTLDFKPHDEESLKHKETVQDISIKGSSSKTIKKKTSSRQSSGKSAKDKSMSTPTNSGRSLPSTPGSQIKINLKDTTDPKTPSTPEQFYKFNPRPMTDKVLSKDVRQTEPKRDKKVTNQKKPKASSQEAKPVSTASEEKPRRPGLAELQYSDNEDESYPQQDRTYIARTKERGANPKLERQRSPITVKLYERIPTSSNNNIGNWGIKPESMVKEGPPMKSKQKEKSREGGSIESKNKNTGGTVTKELVKTKNNSADKLTKVDVYAQWKGKKGDGYDGEKEALKFDLMKPKEEKEKVIKTFDPYGKIKDKKEKVRTTSPPPNEAKRAFDLFDRLLSQKKTIREEL